jgi:WD40 repeat protein
MQFDDGKIVKIHSNILILQISGSLDKTIRKWDAVTAELALTLQGHEGYVSGLQFLDFGLASCSADKTIRMWDRTFLLFFNRFL